MSSLFPQSPYNNIQHNMHQIGYPFILIIGTIGSTLSIGVFAQRTMYQSPCSIYLIAYNIGNTLLIWLAAFPNYLTFVFNIDPGLYNLSLCRCRYYVIFLFAVLCPSYLILASIDRALMTSPETNIRKKSTHRLAYISIIGVTIGWCLFYSHAFVKVNIQEIFPGFSFCIYDAGLYTTLMTWNSILIDGILPPILMIIFALATLKNLLQVKVAPVTTTTTNNQHTLVQKRNQQFIIIVLSEIILYVIFSSMQPIVLLYVEITKDRMKTIDQFYLQWFLARVANFLVYFSSSLPFYVNLVVSKSFRIQIRNMFVKFWKAVR